MAPNDSSKRAASLLTIAQHKFKQALKKEDHDARLPALAVELSAQFIADLDAVLEQNTPANVQKCTAWIVKHIAPSKTRTASLGDYMISVSKSVVVDQPVASAAAVKAASRSRFALLLVTSDVLHTDKFHQRSTAKSGVFGKESMVFTPELVELSAAYMSGNESQAGKKLRAIINFWAVNQLVSIEGFRLLRDRADEALLVAQGVAPVRRRNYLLPEYHGDRNAPWHDLPAAYMLDQMIKSPNKPINPHRIKIAKLDKKPVSPHVRKLLDNYFENIDLKYVPTGNNPTGETTKHLLWLDPMGQLVKQDKETGETNTVYNGYGWSMKLCQDMQKDGGPETIRKAREQAQHEEELEMLCPAPQQQQKSDRRVSPSPRRRRPSSSDSEYGRDRGRRSRCHSRQSSRSSYDSLQDSRSKGRNRSRSRRRESPRRRHTDSDDGGQRFDDRERNQARPSPRPYGREAPGSGQQWTGPQKGNLPINPSNSQYPTPPQNFAQGFSQPPHLSFSAPPYPPPPPQMPNQYPGQFPIQPFPPPPPPPFQPGPFQGSIPPPPPPPPPNFCGSYPPPPPMMTAMPNNPYHFSGNQFGGNMHGSNFGQGQSQGYGQGQNQSNFQGGRGGFRGNFQGGGNNNRGSYGGPQRGQRGGRW